MASIQCKNCGGTVELPTGRQSTTCPYCGGLVERTGSGHAGAGHYMLAKTAFESGNYADAERFCNMHLAQAPDDVDALLLKAQAIGWQQWTGTVRLREVAKNFALALGKVDDADERDELGATIRREFLAIASGKIDEALSVFLASPDKVETDSLKKMYEDLQSAISDVSGLDCDNEGFKSIGRKILKSIDLDYVQSLVRAYQLNPVEEAYAVLSGRFGNCEAVLSNVCGDFADEDEVFENIHATLKAFAKALDENIGFDYVRDRWGAYHQVPWAPQINEEHFDSRWRHWYPTLRKISLMRKQLVRKTRDNAQDI